MIDEKKLIDGSTWHHSVLTKKEPSYQDGWNDCNRDWMKRIAELPNAPDMKVGNKWIPCDGCERKCEKWEHSKTCRECDSTN